MMVRDDVLRPDLGAPFAEYILNKLRSMMMPCDMQWRLANLNDYILSVFLFWGQLFGMLFMTHFKNSLCHHNPTTTPKPQGHHFCCHRIILQYSTITWHGELPVWRIPRSNWEAICVNVHFLQLCMMASTNCRPVNPDAKWIQQHREWAEKKEAIVESCFQHCQYLCTKPLPQSSVRWILLRPGSSLRIASQMRQWLSRHIVRCR